MMQLSRESLKWTTQSIFNTHSEKVAIQAVNHSEDKEHRGMHPYAGQSPDQLKRERLYQDNDIDSSEGSDTSQNSVRDFEIPDFRVKFQISRKISDFCEDSNEGECQSEGESEDKEGCKNYFNCKDLQNQQTVDPMWLLIEFAISSGFPNFKNQTQQIERCHCSYEIQTNNIHNNRLIQLSSIFSRIASQIVASGVTIDNNNYQWDSQPDHILAQSVSSYKRQKVFKTQWRLLIENYCRFQEVSSFFRALSQSKTL